MILNDHWFIEKTREEILKSLELNENENISYQNLWDTVKAALRGKFIARSAYVEKLERMQISKLMMQCLRKMRTRKPQN
jgi:hypothetical protein